MPPRVDCDMGPIRPLPPIPELVGMDKWAIEVMGIYEDIGTAASASAACMAKLRKDGVIQ